MKWLIFVNHILFSIVTYYNIWFISAVNEKVNLVNFLLSGIK